MANSSLFQKDDSLVLTTERTYLRRWTIYDLEALNGLFGDPEVTANIGDGKPFTPEQIIKVLLFFLSHYQKHGFGPWAVIRRDSSEIIGINGIKYLPDFKHVDLGYSFVKKEWGQGLGFETSLAVLKYSLHVLGLKNIGATVSPGNIASIALLKKLGMAYQETVTRNSIATEVYKLIG